MKSKLAFLNLILLVALFVTSNVCFSKPQETKAVHHIVEEKLDEVDDGGLVVTSIDFDFGYENLPRSLATPKNPGNGCQKQICFYLIEKCESRSAEVSYKHFSIIELRQCKKESLFLHLRKILI